MRIESSAGPGVPDVYVCLRPGIGAWLELKELPVWPARPATPVRVPALERRPEQVAWLEAEAAVGGRAYLLLGVGKAERFLLNAITARALFRRELTRADLLERARWASTTGLPGAPLARAIGGAPGLAIR